MINIYIDAFPISQPRVSGIGHMTLELVRALEKHPRNLVDFKIKLVVCVDRIEDVKSWGFTSVEYSIIPMSTRVFNLIWKYNLLPALDIFLGKGVYIFTNYKNWPLALSKSITFVCDIGYVLYPQYLEPKNLEFLKRNMPRWTKRTSKIASISLDAGKDINNKLDISQDKIIKVSCGVNTDSFYKRSKKDTDRFLRSVGLPQKYILFVGNIEPRKNIITLIEAYEQLPDVVRSQYALVLVGGGGWNNEPILKKIQESVGAGNNIIKLQKYISDAQLPLLYSGASILCYVPYYEGFGLPPLQAMACSVPVITAKNSSLPEIASDAALYVDERSVKDVSDKIEELLSDRALQAVLIKKGISQAQKYPWSESANMLIKEVMRI